MKFKANTVGLVKREQVNDDGIKCEWIIVNVSLRSDGDTSNIDDQDILSRILNKLQKV